VPVSFVMRRRGAEESEADIMAYVVSPGGVVEEERLWMLHLVDAMPKSAETALGRVHQDGQTGSLITIG
jgi:hypothetical protein